MSEWIPIKAADGSYTTPQDNSEFWVGVWVGHPIFDDDWKHVAWAGEPEWREAISHNDGAEGYATRGWDHRNGPLGDHATHWRPVEQVPPPAHNLKILPPQKYEVCQLSEVAA